ncbi:HNH endonuclease signature motif containing protein [Humibacter sp.]|uniref:HNH endonuclease signature motif containing protein n=1 Tax=Humibacter sp. TaxID=1940291 RepID=UPI003F7EFABE
MRRFWTPEEDAWLVALYPDTKTSDIAFALDRSERSVYQRADLFGLHKTADYLASPDACRLRRGDNIGVATRFTKGQTPANKGLRRPGWAPGRMADTQFKPGVRQGIAQKLWRPIGTERVSRDGYLERKIHSDLPPKGASRAESARIINRRWRAVHLLVWEAAHGPVPPGHAVVFKNGDLRDIRLDNLALITRADLMRRNSVHNLPAPLPQLVQLIGAVNRKINRRTRHGEEQDRGPQEPSLCDTGRAGGHGEPNAAGPGEGHRGRRAGRGGIREGGSGVHGGDRAPDRHGIHHTPRGADAGTVAARRGTAPVTTDVGLAGGAA